MHARRVIRKLRLFELPVIRPERQVLQDLGERLGDPRFYPVVEVERLGSETEKGSYLSSDAGVKPGNMRDVGWNK